jgi:hypothetical protein
MLHKAVGLRFACTITAATALAIVVTSALGSSSLGWSDLALDDSR